MGAATPFGGATPTTTAGAITIGGAFNAPTGTVELDSLGTNSETGNPADTIANLTGNAGGYVSLTGTANSIGSLGNFTLAAGSFALNDSKALTVNGTVTAPGQIYLESADTTTGISNTGKIAAGTLASIQADIFSNTGNVSGSEFEFAPNTAGATLTLGAGAPSPALASLAGIAAANVRLGAVTLPGSATATTTAGAISVAGAFGSGALNLELDATGAVTESSGTALTANVLSGSASSFSLLNTTNAIGAIGSMSATAGNLFLGDGLPLVIASNVGATGNVFLKSASVTINAGDVVTAGAAATASVQADTFTDNGSVVSGTFEVAPLTSNGVVTLNSGSTAGIGATKVRVGAVTQFPNVGLTTTAGSIVIAGNFGASTISLDLESNGGISELGGAILTAGTLTGNAGATVALGNANAISVLNGFNLAAGSFTLGDGGATSLTANGPVTATSITINSAPTIVVAGVLTAAGGTVQLAPPAPAASAQLRRPAQMRASWISTPPAAVSPSPAAA